ncbi:MAG: 2'-5' RNA ligase family protein [Rhodospirillales bacterium]|nr:MAG: 2'-5' RNA ligase family protein [Rhodospirillales bacterium]
MAVIPFPGPRRGEVPAPPAAAPPEPAPAAAPAARLYVVAEPVLAPDDDEALRRLRAHYHPAEADRIGPHVTLVFGADVAGRDELAAALTAAAGATRPFWFVLQRLRVDAPPGAGRAWLYAEPDEGTEEFRGLYEALNDPMSPPAGSAKSYEPHLTLGVFASPIEAERIARIVETRIVPMHGRIEALRLVEVSAGGLVEIGRYPLGG